MTHPREAIGLTKHGCSDIRGEVIESRCPARGRPIVNTGLTASRGVSSTGAPPIMMAVSPGTRGGMIIKKFDKEFRLFEVFESSRVAWEVEWP